MTSRFTSPAHAVARVTAMGALAALGIAAWAGCGSSDTRSYCDSTGCYTCDAYGCSSTGSSSGSGATPTATTTATAIPTATATTTATATPEDASAPPVDAGPPAPTTCKTDPDCLGTTANPKRCIGGLCRYSCSTDQYCRTIDARIGTCAKDLVCRSSAEAALACNGPADCTSGQQCIADQCQ